MSIYEESITQWRTQILASQKLQTDVVDELEDHLRAELEDLNELNIAEDEKLMLAQQRMGDVTVIENEFYKLDRHKRWLQQLTVMLGGYILFTLLLQLTQVIALSIGSAYIITQFSQQLGAQIYTLCSMSLLALFMYGLWEFSQKRSPIRLLGYQSIQDGLLRKVVQNTISIGLIVMGARMLDRIVAQQMFRREDLSQVFSGGDSPSVMETITSFSFGKSVYDGSTFGILVVVSFVVLMVLIRQQTHQSAVTSS